MNEEQKEIILNFAHFTPDITIPRSLKVVKLIIQINPP